MPTYVYKFIETGETIEVQQSFTDATLTEYVHPTSGETLQVKKVFLPVGVTFKGDGFYKTDSRSSSKATKKMTTDGSSDSASSDGSSSSDASRSDGTSKATSSESAASSASGD